MINQRGVKILLVKFKWAYFKLGRMKKIPFFFKTYFISENMLI